MPFFTHERNGGGSRGLVLPLCASRTRAHLAFSLLLGVLFVCNSASFNGLCATNLVLCSGSFLFCSPVGVPLACFVSLSASGVEAVMSEPVELLRERERNRPSQSAAAVGRLYHHLHAHRACDGGVISLLMGGKSRRESRKK